MRHSFGKYCRITLPRAQGSRHSATAWGPLVAGPLRAPAKQSPLPQLCETRIRTVMAMNHRVPLYSTRPPPPLLDAVAPATAALLPLFIPIATSTPAAPDCCTCLLSRVVTENQVGKKSVSGRAHPQSSGHAGACRLCVHPRRVWSTRTKESAGILPATLRRG